MLGCVICRKGRIFRAMLGEVERAVCRRKQDSLEHASGRPRMPRIQSHSPPDGAREPCACFPDDARSARQQTPSN